MKVEKEVAYIKEVLPLREDVGGGMKIRIHYIGKRYYTVGTFTKEALKHGVSRALPHNAIKKLKWGDRIYTGFYERDEKGTYVQVFGYFTITGINVANPLVTEEVKKDERLKIIKTPNGFNKSDGGGEGSGATVSRGCGSYEIAGTTYIDNSLEELVEIVGDAEKRLGIHTKLMVAGRFTPLPPVAVRGVPFSRSLVYTVVPKDTFEGLKAQSINIEPEIVVPEKSHIVSLKDYKLGKPSPKRKKKVKEALSSMTLDKWVQT